MIEQIQEYQTLIVLFIILALIWSLPWKGYALWLAARNTHTGWFVILLVVNTLAVLDIVYIFVVGKKTARMSGKIVGEIK